MQEVILTLSLPPSQKKVKTADEKYPDLRDVEV